MATQDQGKWSGESAFGRLMDGYKQYAGQFEKERDGAATALRQVASSLAGLVGDGDGNPVVRQYASMELAKQLKELDKLYRKKPESPLKMLQAQYGLELPPGKEGDSALTQLIMQWGENNSQEDRKRQPGWRKTQLRPGTIDLDKRIAFRDPVSGRTMTEHSITVSVPEGDGKAYYNIPTIIEGKPVTREQAIRHFKGTGEHLGSYSDLDDAVSAAKEISAHQEKYYGR